ncbi:hypothetical protein [Maritalea sp.]|uniref:hypothetical protein n=1 Tax=Maritalea sp. TaxID=2003361 RepID=UPI0039E62CB4
MENSLKEKVRQWVLRNLPYDHADAVLDAHLKSLDAHALLVVYHNWSSRLIAPVVRNVHISATLHASLQSSRHRIVVNEIVKGLEAGKNLNSHLSKGISNVASLPRHDKKLNRRRDLDLLLLDWGIHHLHLSTQITSDGFVERTNDLLFLVVKPQNAYLIDIMSHGNWHNERLVEIMFKELGGAETVHEMKGVVGLSPEPSEEERKQLRNVGVNSAMMIDGKAVMTLGGMSAAGTSVHATRDADRLLDAIENFENNWNMDSSTLREVCQNQGVKLPQVPDFDFDIPEGSGPGVFERHTGTFIPLM